MQNVESVDDSRLKDDEQWSRARTRTNSQKKDTLSTIRQKMIKAQQIKTKQKPKTDFYTVLTTHLETKLKTTKFSNQKQLKQKFFLLQKCRNQKHTRDSSRSIAQCTKGKVFNSTRSLIYDHTHLCINPSRLIHTESSNLKPINPGNKKYISLATLLENKVYSIKMDCIVEHNKSQQLKEEFKAVYFYQNIIDRNLKKIVNKIG